MLDTSSASVLCITDFVSSSRSPVMSLSVRMSPTHDNLVEKSNNETEGASHLEIAFVLTRDSQVILMDCSTGNMISSQPSHPKEKSIALSMHILGMCASSLQYLTILCSISDWDIYLFL